MSRRLCLLAALLAGTGRASDLEALTAALQQARTLTARGSVEVQVLFPPRAVPTRTAQVLPRVPFRPALIAQHFHVTQREAAPIAGRDVTRFDLTPKVGQAARWTLWIDRTWNVPLAYEERMPDGNLARRAAFTRVSATPVRRSQPVPAVPAGLRAAVLAALPGLRFPPGFTPTEVQARAAGGVEITLSDGINVLALVIAPRNVRAAPGVASRRVGQHFVWLVGNLPDAPLRRALAEIEEVKTRRLGTFLGASASNT
ncbi:sigma E regulatory protein MucB/RseB [Deinococcus sp. YIM 77859]|uniref:sigma E regulatory protein MucB/RseB n=1 Tax=Deinococcus sp. YIM 77859 TaxID=1540221 RepID=UPI0005526012|nr:sigma E regulatory protein MucB/RseB [Deinococcus sp. YIM 77859]